MTQHGSNPTVVAVEVGNVVTVSNIGDEVLNPVVVSDSEAALSTSATGWVCDATGCVGALALGGSVTFTQTYLPDGVNIVGALTDPGSVEFVNTATASGAGVLSDIPVGPKSATATCRICLACEPCD